MIKAKSSTLTVLFGLAACNTPTGPCHPPSYAADVEIARIQANDAEELRAVRIDGARAYVCGAATVRSYDVSGAQARELARVALPAPCRRLAVARPYLAITLEPATLATFAVAADGTLAPDASSTGAAGETFFDVAAQGADLYVAAGAAGVHHLQRAAGSLGSALPANVGGTDARGVAIVGGRLLVADGAAGVKLISTPCPCSVIAQAPTQGTASRAVVSADGLRAAILLGPDGVELFDLSSGLTSRGATHTQSVAVDGAIVGDDLLVADLRTWTRVSLGTRPPAVLGSVRRDAQGQVLGSWAVAAAASGARAVLLYSDGLAAATVRPHVPAPRLETDTYGLAFYTGETGAEPTLIRVHNPGDAPLFITKMASSNPVFTARPAPVPMTDEPQPDPACPGILQVPAGSVSYLGLSLGPVVDTQPLSALLHLESNAPTTPTDDLALAANFHRLATGDAAPDFTVPLLDGSGLFSLSEHRGQVVMLKFFNPG